MNMQDKELDELFRAQLADFEMQPSSSVWNKVARELDNKNPKKGIAPLLAIAATVLALLTAGILFLNRQTNMGKAGQHNPIAVNRKGPKPAIGSEIDRQAIKKTEPLAQQRAQTLVQPELAIAKTDRPNNSRLIKQPRKVASPAPAMPQVATPSVTTDEQDQQQILAAVVQHKTDVAKPVVPDITLNTTTTQPEQTDNNPVVSTTVEASNTVKPKKHGIRSFGDMVNAVVSKVDKRTDKVIEFSNTDDDEATITGLNLGIVKIKKEK